MVNKKLQEARIALQSKQLKKSGLNKFANFQYFELADFLPTVQEIFHQIGLSSTVCFTADLATLKIVDTEDGTSDTFTCPVVVPTMKGCNEVQALGAMTTYIRRYLYVNALEIVEHDAMDAVVGKDEKKPITPAAGTWESLDVEEQKYLQGVADSVIAELNNGDVESAVTVLEAEKLDADEKVAIWTRFDSKQRSAMKKQITLNKEKQ